MLRHHTEFLECTCSPISIIGAWSLSDAYHSFIVSFDLLAQTRSPGLKCLTLMPISSTVPATSRPPIHGKLGIQKLYSTLFQSIGFNPTALTRIIISSGVLIVGNGIFVMMPYVLSATIQSALVQFLDRGCGAAAKLLLESESFRDFTITLSSLDPQSPLLESFE